MSAISSFQDGCATQATKAGCGPIRTVYVVEAVYYRPDKRNSDADDSWVVLVVHDRQMKEEAELL